MHRRIGRYRRSNTGTTDILKYGMSLALCLFPVTNGALFMQNKLGFRVTINGANGVSATGYTDAVDFLF